MAIEQETTIDSPDLFHVNSDEQYMKTRAELWSRFKNFGYSNGIDDRTFESMCDNTLLIADKCEKFTVDMTPKIPEIHNADEELKKLVAAGLKSRGLDKNKRKFVIDGKEVTYVDQARIELNRFIDKGFASYFLITRDLIQYGKRQGWPFSPRGCTTPNSIINTTDGHKAIIDINIGDGVLDGFGCIQTVENKFIYDVSEELYVFTLDNDVVIKVTADHKLYIIRDGGVVMLLKASEIKDVDKIISSIQVKDNCEGDKITATHISTHLSSSQIQNINKLQKLVSSGTIKKFGIKKITTEHYTGKVYDIQVSNTNSYDLAGVFSSNSAGGSLVCFLIGIHVLDPMLWGLSFDRFLSPSRGGYMLDLSVPKEI